MTRRAFAVAVVLLACSRDPSSTPPAPTSSHASNVPTLHAAAPSATAPEGPSPLPSANATALPPPATPASLAPATALPISARSIGHTSVVYKLAFAGGEKYAFKPRSRRGPLRYKGEVAAFRLATALGLSNVPRAFVHSFDAAGLRAVLDADGATLFDREAILEAGRTKGALIPWITTLDFLPLEADPWRSRWRAWLKRGGVIPEGETKLASEISTMIVFDYVTGNFDRWSGGNVGRDKVTGELLFIDNDGAFFEVPKADALARQLAILRETERFSKSFVKALERLGPDELRAAMGDDTPGTPLVSDRVLAGVNERRERAIAEIADDERFFE